MKATFKAIPNVFLNRLSKITSRIDDNAKMIINQHYPSHIMALSKAGLNVKIFTNLKDVDIPFHD